MSVRHAYPYPGNPIAGGDTPVFGLGGYPTVSIQVIGTLSSGSYTPQVSNDGGQTWGDIQVVSAGGTAASTIDAVGLYRIDANGFQALRLNPSSPVGDHSLLMFATEEPFSRPGTGGGAASDVNLESVGGTATATGNGTANAGTQRVVIASNQTAFAVTPSLPTGASTSALQTTGNTSLAAIEASAAILDDWDESDRAKVNPIVGQAGVAAGAGAVGATVQRTTLASDDPAVVALQIMDDWDESDRAKVNPIVGQAGVAGGSGTVGATTQRVTLATDVALPAGTNLLGRVSASNETSAIYNGTTALTPKFAVISAASSGDNTLVAAVASNHIRVVALNLVSSGAVSVRFESGAGGTALTGVMPLIASSGFTLPYNPVGWFETGVNTLLNLELSAATGVYGFLTYIEVP